MIKLSALALVLSGAFFASIGSSQVSLNVVDGEVGGSVSFEFEGPPNATYLNLISLTAGPTCFPPPHLPDCVPLGVDQLPLSFQIPGFFSNLGPTGQRSLSFSLPSDPALDGLVVRDILFQVTNGVLSHVSKMKKITLAYPDSFALSLGQMFTPHFATPAVTLDDGRVLLAGGSGAPGNQVEAYDSRCETFENLPVMALGVAAHTVTKLMDGRVLAVGGVDAATNNVEKVAQIFDPATGTWSLTGSLQFSRAGHAASLLPDGRVLVSGGSNDISDPVAAAVNALDSTEIYDPATGAFSPGPTMNDPRVAHSSTALSNGEVMIAGGLSYTFFIIRIPVLLDTAQRFTAGTDTLSGSISVGGPRAAHSAILLDDGRVLLAGGVGGSVASPRFLDTLALSNSAGTSFSASSSTMSSGRGYPAVAQLARGEVLIAGGEQGDIANSSPVKDTDLFDPALDTCVATTDLHAARTVASAVPLPDGSVAVFGGSASNTNAELYHD